MPISKSKPKVTSPKVTSKRRSKPVRNAAVDKSAHTANPRPIKRPSTIGTGIIPSGFKPLKVVKQLAADYDLSLKDVAGVLDVTPKTYSRWRGRDSALSEQQADRTLILKAIFDLGSRVLGSDGNLKKWIREPVFSLDGQTPLKLLKTESGRRRIESVLHQIEYGFF
jgi:putative toxin-antitoxin system antitoxin component (TIGR02293 family)